MNYEQKYNDALDIARTFYEGLIIQGHNGEAGILAEIFSELKESEDERIRKGIIRNLQYLMDRSEGFVKEDLQERIAWLEKQGESTITNIEIPFGANDSELQEVSYNIPEGFYAEIKDDRVVIKKVEPKFKVGDWVIKNGIVAQILDKQKYGFVGLDIDGKDFFCNYGHTDSMRLWTINDAKDGDVLAYVTDEENLWIMIYRSLYEPYEGHVHYHALLVNDNFSDKGTCCICIDNLKPATKEQRDLLFSKMKEAGYEWTAEKKELKKIEPKMLNADKVIEWIDEHVHTKFEEMQNYVNQFKKDFGL